MKSRIAFLTALLLSTLISTGQKKDLLFLRSGTVSLPSNISPASIESINSKITRFEKNFLILQFNEPPTEFIKQQLSAQGIELVNYIPENAYTAIIKGSLKTEVLLRSDVRAIYQLSPQQKMESSLAAGMPPAYSVKTPGTVDAWIRVIKIFTVDEVISSLKKMNIDVISTSLSAYQVLHIRLDLDKIFQLAQQPFVEYMLPAPPPDQPLNNNSRSLSHANVLNASIANGGKGLNGEGITIGIGDNADIQSHIDFNGRLINRNAAQFDYHGMHTSGTAAGAGILNEMYRGYLPKATIISQLFNGIWTNASTYVADYNMVITNNSYGAIVGCEYNGVYDLASNVLDQQAFDLPYLQHVFSAGNGGNNTCAPYPQGFRTVMGSYQSAKNIICVGNSNFAGGISAGSSRGPVLDGRLKPDITAQGANVTSTWGNYYSAQNGTSMSAPAVAGGLALLYQRYRQLNGNLDPKNALMKVLLCNGANDRGNTGPDFKNGFGSMNLLRSIDMLENAHYFAGNITKSNSATHSFIVPANTAKLKVMLYWNDPASSMLSLKTLVNDLDLEIINPASSIQLPLVLDSTQAHVDDVAIPGADHTNNMEQVVIENPAAGNYSIKVKGTAINQNPSQEYFVVYDAIPNSIQLTYPLANEGLVPGEFVNIAWDAYGDEASSYTLQYSINAGSTWNDLSTNITAGTQFFSWQVPVVATDEAMVRVIKNTTGQTSTSNKFTILGQPVVALSATQCEGYFAIEWPAISNATSYQVMLLKGPDMEPIATTTSNSYIFNNLSKDSIYWVGVRAGINGKWGRRSIAVSRQPNTGTCAGSISDNDLKLNAILSPLTGRKFTSTELAATSVVSVAVKNMDDVASSNFTLKYSIDNGASWITENVGASIPAGGVYNHNFTPTVNFSAIASYNLVAVVINSNPDFNTNNDTLKMMVRHLDNPALNLASLYKDDLETLSEKQYNNKEVGLAGNDRYDFENTTALGRLRTFINTGISFSGKRALSMDIKTQSPAANVNYLMGTYNLSDYNANTKELRLDFRFNFHGTNATENNKVWIRGKDTDPWITMYDLFPNKAEPGIYKLSSSIELSDSLLKYGQNFSASFQVRWAQNGFFQAVDKRNAAGVSIDDIRFYEVVNDVQLLSIDAPSGYSCNFTNAVPVTISIHNGVKGNLTNVPVKYSINGGNWVTETIPSLAGETTLQYTFAKLADLSLPGSFTIKAVVDFNNDSFHDNDTLVVVVQSLPLITNFPYLQNFETNNGGWFANGAPNSWQYGTPASTKIKTAASGTKAWKTRLAGNYNDMELSYLHSPCFTIGVMSKPTLSFSVALDLENCGATACDRFWVEYSEDGSNWVRLVDSTNSSTNWYNHKDNYWSIENYTRWHVATVNLPTGISQIRLRFVLLTDPAVNREGIAIDDVHVYDNTKGIFQNSTTSAVSQTITGGNTWVHFEKEGKLIASIHPNNQNLGLTHVQAYVYNGPVRNTGTQYYHNRSITIKPEKPSLTDSAIVRFYFLDSETDSLLFASGCAGCSKPSNAYELGVSQYDDYDSSFENGSINDNQQGLWTFFNSARTVKVPFDKGYYAEFKVRDFSEFWLNNGAPDRNTPLPVKLFNFSLQRTGTEDVVVNWTVGSENNVARYEIEVARTATAMQANEFEKIGDVASMGNSTMQRQYSFLDKETFKSGTRYYRIKTINQDGSFTYSLVRSILFDSITNAQVLPNPSTGKFFLVYQANGGAKTTVQLTNAIGKLIKTYTASGNGFVQKISIDISAEVYARGIYMLQVYSEGKMQTFKLYKQ